MKEQQDHLKLAVDYIQNRINAVDNKASVLIAIQAGLFGVATFVVERIYLPCEDLKIISYVVLTVVGLFTAVVVGFLLQVIRPTKHFLSRDSGMPPLESSEILWPKMDVPPTVANFKKRVDEWNIGDMEKDLRVAVFANHYMVFKKYKSYRSALWLAKIQLIVIFALLLLIPLWKFF